MLSSHFSLPVLVWKWERVVAEVIYHAGMLAHLSRLGWDEFCIWELPVKEKAVGLEGTNDSVLA